MRKSPEILTLPAHSPERNRFFPSHGLSCPDPQLSARNLNKAKSFGKTRLKTSRKLRVIGLILTSEPPPPNQKSERPQEASDVWCHLFAPHMGCNICRGPSRCSLRRGRTVGPFTPCWTGLNPTCSVCRTHTRATHTSSTHHRKANRHNAKNKVL